MLNAVALSLFASRMQAVCDEMGAVLRRAAFSPNIKERLDFSCAVFDADGGHCAQAAHIPVHLGSMAYAMRAWVHALEWAPGDMVIVNDPFLGGTHLPDVTAIAPVFANGHRVGFVANRAHHADIGAHAPGSMPISRSLEEEGLVIAPAHLVREGRIVADVFESILEHLHNRAEAQGDFRAQISANRCAMERVRARVEAMGVDDYAAALSELNAYAERLARSGLERLPEGTYRFRDTMDDDGLGHEDILIEAAVTLQGSDVTVDFAGTAAQTPGNINCPLSVTAAAVFYVFRCLMPRRTPAVAGALRPVQVRAPEGSLVHARRPAAVAAGNVETSTRIVDVVMGALAQAAPDRIPAASHGSMNNVAMGSRGACPWDYYETIGGGMGAGPHGGGLSGLQTHLTNTRNTPVEALELRYPLRVRRYALRQGSGGAGRYGGGDGIIREFEFTGPARVTLLTERRRHAPWGLAGGGAGQRGENRRNGLPLGGKVAAEFGAGDRLEIATPGGGGWGEARSASGESESASEESQ